MQVGEWGVIQNHPYLRSLNGTVVQVLKVTDGALPYEVRVHGTDKRLVLSDRELRPYQGEAPEEPELEVMMPNGKKYKLRTDSFLYRVYRTLEESPRAMTTNEVRRTLKTETGRVSSALSELRARGYVKHLSTGLWASKDVWQALGKPSFALAPYLKNGHTSAGVEKKAKLYRDELEQACLDRARQMVAPESPPVPAVADQEGTPPPMPVLPWDLKPGTLIEVTDSVGVRLVQGTTEEGRNVLILVFRAE